MIKLKKLVPVRVSIYGFLLASSVFILAFYGEDPGLSSTVRSALVVGGIAIAGVVSILWLWMASLRITVRKQTGRIQNDLDEIRAVEAALRVSERRLREAQQLAHLGNWFWDVNSGAVEWSDEVYRIFQLDPEEFTPQIDSILALSPWPGDRQRDQELIQRAVESREAGSYEQRFLRPDGSTGYYFSTFQGVYDDDGALTAITGTVQDITDRKRVEESLQREQEFVRALLENMVDGVVACDAAGKLALFNRTAREWHGLDPLHIPQEEWASYYGLYAEDGATPLTVATIPLVRAFRGERLRDAALVIQAKAQIPRYITSNCSPFYDSAGQLLGAVAVMRDLTAARQAQKELEDTKILLEATFEQTPVPMVLVSVPDGVMRIVNLAAVRFLIGENNPSPIGQRFLDYKPSWQDFDGEGRPIPLAELPLALALQGVTTRSKELNVLRKDGTWRWNLASAAPVYNAAGEQIAAFLAFPDITERKMAEKALQESEERYRTLVRNFPNGAVTLFDHDLRYMIADGIGLAAVGLSPKLMEGKTIWEMFPPEICEAIEPDHRSALAGRTTINRVLYKDHVYLTHTLPVRNEQGQIIAGMVMTQDITEQVQAEKAIQQYTTRLESQRQIDQAILEAQSLKETAQSVLKYIYQLLSFNRISVVLFDFKAQQGVVLAVYSPEETMLGAELTVPLTTFGYIVDEIRSGKTRLVKNVHTLTQLTPMDSNLMAEGVLSYVNIPLIARGDLIGMLNLGANEPDAFSEAHIEVAQEVAAQLAVAIQQAYLHEQVQRYADQLESRVEERTAQLEAANKELEAFSYSVSHDLRAPLRAIDGYTRILMQDYESALDAEGRRICSVIRHQTGRMSQLIDDMLAFSRLGRAQMQAVSIDMERLVHTVFDELTTVESRERLDFRMGNLPPVVGDPTLVRQVWINLLANALKFSSKRERAVIEVGSQRSDGETVYWVRDNGAGFDMQYAGKLFGVFQRLHSEKEFAGTGVGLAIVQRIIHRHGGRVWAESAVDQGATFYFTLSQKGD